MNQQARQNCERIEALLPSYVEGGLGAADEAVVRSHIETCDACRASLVTFAMIEESLVSRRAEVPPAEQFMPDFAAARAPVSRAHPHPRLVGALRTMMSVPGVSIILVMWSAMFLLRFRDTVGRAFSWTSLDRLSAFTREVQNVLVGVSGDNPWTLTAIYAALTLALLASTGAITLRYIRQS